jgi:hypothetical protein
MQDRHVQRVPNAVPVEAAGLEELPEVSCSDDQTEWEQDRGNGKLLLVRYYTSPVGPVKERFSVLLF